MAEEAAEKYCEGNECFVDEDYEAAIKLYSQAIKLDSSKSDYYLKRCNTYIKLEQYEDAVKDADKAIKIAGKSSKIYQRKGFALFSSEKYEDAIKVYKEALELDKNSEQVEKWVRKCEAEIDLKKRGPSRNKLSIGLSKQRGPVDAKKEKIEELPSEPVANGTTNATSPKKEAIPMPASKIKYDWYQTDNQIVLTVLIKNLKKEDVSIDFGSNALSCSAKLPSGSDYSLELDLAHEIVPAQSSYSVLGTKIEIKMKKAEGIRWSSLETDNESQFANVNTATKTTPKTDPDKEKVRVYPTSAHTPRDWDRLAKEVQEEEKKENMEGDGALNKLFQQIYADASDETKRAMNKSFQESGGTVLSTNWGEVGKEKVEIKPPDCMEYKKYEY